MIKEETASWLGEWYDNVSDCVVGYVTGGEIIYANGAAVDALGNSVVAGGMVSEALPEAESGRWSFQVSSDERGWPQSRSCCRELPDGTKVWLLIFRAMSPDVRLRNFQKDVADSVALVFEQGMELPLAFDGLLNLLVDYMSSEAGAVVQLEHPQVRSMALTERKGVLGGGFRRFFQTLPDGLCSGLSEWLDSHPLECVHAEDDEFSLGVEEWDGYLREKGIRTVCGVPMNLGDIPWGCLCLFFQDGTRELTEMDKLVLQAFQQAAGVLLTHDSLVDMLKREGARAEAAERAKKFFFSVVGTHIRTPLNTIIGYAELLKLGEDDQEEVDQYAESIIFSGNTLMQMMNDVLDLAKLETGNMRIVPCLSDIRKTVNGVILSFEQQAQKAGVLLQMECEPLPEVEIDSARLRQILVNLVGNALKYTYEGSVTVSVAFKAEDEGKGMLVIAVRDTGIGIDDEKMEKLRQPLVELDEAERMEGSGLGLSVCNSLLAHMNGNLRIESRLGIGSVFTATFMDVPYHAESELKTVAAAMDGGLKRALSLLLVDDVDLNLKVLQAICRKVGVANVVSVHSGLEALTALRREKFDAVLTDIWMPQMNGEQLVTAIRQNARWADLPVFAVTVDEEILRKHQTLGFTGVLLKPLTVARLMALLKEI